MKRKLATIFLLSAALSLCVDKVYSWGTKTHSEMTFNAVKNVNVVYPTANQGLATNPLSVRLSNLLGFPIDCYQGFQGPAGWGTFEFAYLSTNTSLDWMRKGAKNEDASFEYLMGNVRS